MKLPGFLLEPEIARLPEQVSSLTAVPVFIGYVQKLEAAQRGNLAYITRYSDYERQFCLDGNSNDVHPWPSAKKWGPFLRSSLYLYFLNGGGPCYVLPVGKLETNHPPEIGHFSAVKTAMDRVPEITMIVPTDAILLPPADYFQFCQDVLQHCAAGSNRFCIFDAGSSTMTANGSGYAEAKKFSQTLGEQYLQWGAAYFPYLQLPPKYAGDEGVTADGETKLALPSAVVAAAYAVTDMTRGIWKAPANVPIKGILGLSTQLSLREMGELYAPEDGKSVNLIRAIHGRGIYIWGARTLAGHDLEWRYINVRRLVSFVETSLRNRTLFAVFEPNSMRTWIILKGICDSFLKGLWEAGGLAGNKQEEAFKVTVGVGESMTQADLDEGRLIALVRIAPKRPAEFITVRLFHQVQALGN